MRKTALRIFSVCLCLLMCVSAVSGLTASAQSASRWTSYYDADSGFYAEKCAHFDNGPALEVGSSVYFGAYPQEKGDSEYNTRDYDSIEWVVLASNGGTATLISKYALDSRPFHNRKEATCWAYCSLREWLNEDFYDMAFSREQKKLINTSYSYSSPNPVYKDTAVGPDTEDQVTILNAFEADSSLGYWDLNYQRFCKPTDYAVEHGAFQDDKSGCWWWVNTPGITQKDCASTNSDGSMDYDDGSVNSAHGCVRPVINITIPD